jgi:hypothetical protein
MNIFVLAIAPLVAHSKQIRTLKLLKLRIAAYWFSTCFGTPAAVHRNLGGFDGMSEV